MTAQQKNIPVLRFKDEQGKEYPEWEEKRLGDVAELTSSKRVFLSDYVKKGVPFFRGKEITELKANQQPTDILYIKPELYQEFKVNYGVPEIGDLLMTAVGTLGNVLRIKDNQEFYFKDGNLIWFRKLKVLPSFLEILLDYENKTIQKSSIGSTQRALTMVELRKLSFCFACKPEQQKIADFLSAVDERIQQLTQKKNLLEQYKKGVMQQIFSQQIRFKDEQGNDYPEWEEKRLGDVALINPSTGSLPDSFVYIDLESVSKGILLKENVISKTEAPSRAQRLLEEGDILYQTVRPYQKNNLFFSQKGSYVASTGYAQIRAKGNPQFIYQLLHTESFVNDVMLRCTGTSYPAINSSSLVEIVFNYPMAKHEQQKIADFLSSIDNKITLVNTQIEQSQNFKKGLLQQMFV